MGNGASKSKSPKSGEMDPAELRRVALRDLEVGEKCLRSYPLILRQADPANPTNVPPGAQANARCALDTTYPNLHTAAAALLLNHRAQIERQALLTAEELTRLETVIKELALKSAARRRQTEAVAKAFKNGKGLPPPVVTTKLNGLDSVTTIESEALSMKQGIVNVETALRILVPSYAMIDELADSVPQFYVEKVLRKRPRRNTPAESHEKFLHGLEAYRRMVKALEKRLQAVAPDENTWHANNPTVMVLIAWRRGHVEGNVTPPVGTLPVEVFMRDLEGVSNKKERFTKLWIWNLKKATQGTRSIDKFYEDGVPRNPADGTPMNVPGVTTGANGKALVAKLKRDGRSMMIGNCQLVERATAQMIEEGTVMEDSEEMHSLVREVSEWRKMAMAVQEATAGKEVTVETVETVGTVGTVVVPAPPTQGETKDQIGAHDAAAVVDTPSSSRCAPRLSFDESVKAIEGVLVVDLIPEAVAVAVDSLEAWMPIAPFGELAPVTVLAEMVPASAGGGGEEEKEGLVAC